MLKRLLLLSLAAWLVAACATPNVYYDAAKSHHRPHGFNNIYLDSTRIGEGFWQWQWNRLWQSLPADRPERVPRLAVDLGFLKANRQQTTATWVGHATALWQIGGKNLLVDPHFFERASPLSFAGPKRMTAPAIALADLPHIDAVMISHNHYDHLDRPSVLGLDRQPGGPPLFVVPLGMDLWLRGQGVQNVKALDWWQQHDLDGVRLTLVPAQHWSARSPFDRNAVLWGGYVAQADGFSMYYSGDTGYSKDFADIAARFGGFDFAQLPVGCYEPRWFMSNQHVNEPEAIQIHRDVRSRFTIGVHWGTFRLCDDPVDQVLDEFPKAVLAAGLQPGEFVLPALGQTFLLRKAAN